MSLKPFAGASAPVIMGVLNVTPDSFSDGGMWADVRSAVLHAVDMVEAGAGIIDVGGESTRPYSDPVPASEELSRLEPVLRELIPVVDVPVSVDTMKASVARRCIDLGCTVVNDMYGLRAPGMLEVCAESDVDVVIAHMHGMPSHMQDSPMEGPFMRDIRTFLAERASLAMEAGIGRGRIAVDPGIGFGKTDGQNMSIVRESGFFSDEFPVLTGSSRKGFLRRFFPERDLDDVSAEMAVESIRSGASVVRVHDVSRTVDFVKEAFSRRR